MDTAVRYSLTGPHFPSAIGDGEWKVLSAWVGDTRSYAILRTGAEPLTTDHTIASEKEYIIQRAQYMGKRHEVDYEVKLVDTVPNKDSGESEDVYGLYVPDPSFTKPEDKRDKTKWMRIVRILVRSLDSESLLTQCSF